MLKDNEFQPVIDQIHKIFEANHSVSLLDAIAILIAMAVESSVAAYHIEPKEYYIIQNLWKDLQKNLPVVPTEQHAGAGIA